MRSVFNGSNVAAAYVRHDESGATTPPRRVAYSSQSGLSLRARFRAGRGTFGIPFSSISAWMVASSESQIWVRAV